MQEEISAAGIFKMAQLKTGTDLLDDNLADLMKSSRQPETKGGSNIAAHAAPSP
jgi:hypothetical protein